MLRTVLHRITTTSVAPKLATKLLGPAAMAVSARYAGSLATRNSRRSFSTQTKPKDDADNVIVPPFDKEHMVEDLSFDENEWSVAKSTKSRKQLDPERFVRDDTFDANKAYETAVHVMEEASGHTALGVETTAESALPAFEEPTPEELLEVDLEHNQFVTDHTFDVNDAKLQKNVPPHKQDDPDERNQFVKDHTFDVNDEKKVQNVPKGTSSSKKQQ